jgi:hypothetical protein
VATTNIGSVHRVHLASVTELLSPLGVCERNYAGFDAGDSVKLSGWVKDVGKASRASTPAE